MEVIGVPNSFFNIYQKPATSPSSGINYNFLQESYKNTINWAIKRLAIDSNRIYLQGSSAGACGAFVFALAYPEKNSCSFFKRSLLQCWLSE
jgi:hypothetical protein